MKEILGNNLEQFFFVLDYPKEYGAICTYKSNKYEVWLMDDEIFNMIADISEEEFIKFAGEDAWWRSSNGSVLYSLDKGEITINNQRMIGWIRKPWNEEISKDINYQSLSEYLSEPNLILNLQVDSEELEQKVKLAMDKYIENVIVGNLDDEIDKIVTKRIGALVSADRWNPNRKIKDKTLEAYVKEATENVICDVIDKNIKDIFARKVAEML